MTHFVAQLSRTTDIAYTCSACSYRGYAEVETLGEGHASSGDDAQDGAWADAEQRALDTLLFVRCPVCEEIPLERRRQFWTRYVSRELSRAAIAAATFLVVWWANDFGPTFVPIFMGFIVLLGIALAYRFARWEGRPWVNAEERTEFYDEPPQVA